MTTKMTRTLGMLAAGALSLLAALPGRAYVPPGLPEIFPCKGTRVATPFTIKVNGEDAVGKYAAPSTDPKGLVVFAHGYGHTTDSWRLHMQNAADRGFLAVGMDYRGLTNFGDTDGDGNANSRGWNAIKGAEDLVAAGKLFADNCSTVDKVIAFGVSMGGNMSGLAVAEGAKRSNGSPLFDYWVDVEGATNVAETGAEARLVAKSGNAYAVQAYEDIKVETGGDIEQVPDEYARRTVVLQADRMKAGGLKGVVLIHGIDDGLVPFNQSKEMLATLRANRVPTDMYVVATKDADSEKETTLTSYAVPLVYKDWNSPLAGHASEKSEIHIIMETAFKTLWGLFGGDAPVCHREFLVEGATVTTVGNPNSPVDC